MEGLASFVGSHGTRKLDKPQNRAIGVSLTSRFFCPIAPFFPFCALQFSIFVAPYLSPPELPFFFPPYHLSRNLAEAQDYDHDFHIAASLPRYLLLPSHRQPQRLRRRSRRRRRGVIVPAAVVPVPLASVPSVARHGRRSRDPGPLGL